MRKFMVLLMVCSAFGLIGCDNGTTSMVNGGETGNGTTGGNQPQTGTISVTVTGIPEEAQGFGRSISLAIDGEREDRFIGIYATMTFTFESMQEGEVFLALGFTGGLNTVLELRTTLTIGNNEIPFSYFQ